MSFTKTRFVGPLIRNSENLLTVALRYSQNEETITKSGERNLSCETTELDNV